MRKMKHLGQAVSLFSLMVKWLGVRVIGCHIKTNIEAPHSIAGGSFNSETFGPKLREATVV